ncbi:hypothetical protein [Microbacterium ulmi]|uniref:Uncharacterized protein n=1 Tax=Microbacterium ulmi TaxID=179095 RepID=A0A7Y2Q194_9MICO|nr:hypothetical protein [Microbacterium ulmi]NII70652.1 hypothetical protein [Microbacterium ulmi]NNH04107.1 hypothetical protein [Microbacterium ulmi]
MEIAFPHALFAAGLSIFVFLALSATLVLSVITVRRPTTAPLLVAGTLVVFSTVLVAASPVDIVPIAGIVIAPLGLAVGVVGGNPVTRRVLEVATGGRVRETADGGILLPSTQKGASPSDFDSLLRGGTTIGYLERLAVVIAIIAGYPEAIAVVVAIKGIGRFSELAAAEARERFIIGTLASLLWACVVGALVRLAIW